MKQDIELYQLNPEEYHAVQNLRPDYRGAIQKTVDAAVKYEKGNTNINVADFCGGVGQVTKKIAEQLAVSRASIIDINEQFLKIVKISGINVRQLETICSDIRPIGVSPDRSLSILG